MPIEIIFFTLLLNYSIFYGKSNKVFYLICVLFSFLSKFSFSNIEGEFFSINIFIFALFIALMFKFCKVEIVNYDFCFYLLFFLIFYQILIMHDVFNSTHFNFIYFALIVFPVIKLLLKEKFVTFITLFCLFGEVINYIEFKNTIGFINLIPLEVIWILLMSYCVNFIVDGIVKLTGKRGVCFG